MSTEVDADIAFDLGPKAILAKLVSAPWKLRNLPPEYRAYLKNMAWLALSMTMASIGPLIVPHFIGQISKEHLRAFSLLGYLNLFGGAVLAAIGQPMYNFVNFEKDYEEVRPAFSAIVLIGIIISVIGFFALVLLRPAILSLFKIENVPGIDSGYYLMAASSAQIASMGALYYATSYLNNGRLIFFIEMFSLIFSISICLWISNLKTDDSRMFMYLIAAQLAASFLYMVALVILLRRYLAFDVSNLLSIWTRYLVYIPAFLKVWFYENVFPLLVSTMLVWSIPTNEADSEVVAAFNMAILIYSLISLPIYAIALTAPGWIAKTMRFKRITKEYKEQLEFLILITLILPPITILLVLPFTYYINWYLFEFKSFEAQMIMSFAVLSLVPEYLCGTLIVHYRANDRHDEIASARLKTLIAMFFLVAITLLIFSSTLPALFIACFCAPTYQFFILLNNLKNPKSKLAATRISQKSFNIEMIIKSNRIGEEIPSPAINYIALNEFVLTFRNLSKPILHEGQIVDCCLTFSGLVEVKFQANVKWSKLSPIANSLFNQIINLQYKNISEEDMNLLRQYVMPNYMITEILN